MQTIPLHSSSVLDLFTATIGAEMELPLASDTVSAGFPSPANDFLDATIDLNRHLIRHPAATFYGRVKGDSMKDAGIHDGDLLIIDKSLEPSPGKVAVCFIDGEFTVKTIRLEKGVCWLMPANEDYAPLKVTAENDFKVWGIVTYVIKSF